jgi:hypothetical protein
MPDGISKERSRKSARARVIKNICNDDGARMVKRWFGGGLGVVQVKGRYQAGSRLTLTIREGGTVVNGQSQAISRGGGKRVAPLI